MTELSFRLSGGEVFLTGFYPGGPNVEFAFEKRTDGFLRAGTKTLPLIGGRCKISAAELPLGDFTPILVLDEGAYPLPRLFRKGETIGLSAPCGEEFAALRNRLRQSEEAAEQNEFLLSQLRDKVFGTTLF